MPVTDKNSVDRRGGQELKEPRDDRIAWIDEQAGTVVLDEVATTGTPGGGKPAGAAEDSEPQCPGPACRLFTVGRRRAMTRSRDRRASPRRGPSAPRPSP